MEAVESAFDGLSGVVDDVMKEIRGKFQEASQHAGIWESLQNFIAAVDWTEPWIIGLLAVQALLFLSVIIFRRHQNYNTVVLVVAATLVYNARRINAYLRQHWQRFARQPYFDKQGVFISAVVSAPLLLTMFAQLVIYLAMSSYMLVDMKRKELRYKARQRARQEKEGVQPTENKKTS